MNSTFIKIIQLLIVNTLSILLLISSAQAGSPAGFGLGSDSPKAFIERAEAMGSKHTVQREINSNLDPSDPKSMLAISISNHPTLAKLLPEGLQNTIYGYFYNETLYKLQLILTPQHKHQIRELIDVLYQSLQEKYRLKKHIPAIWNPTWRDARYHGGDTEDELQFYPVGNSVRMYYRSKVVSKQIAIDRINRESSIKSKIIDSNL